MYFFFLFMPWMCALMYLWKTTSWRHIAAICMLFIHWNRIPCCFLWVNISMNEWMNERTNARPKEKMNEQTNERSINRTIERWNGWMNDWMNEWIYFCWLLHFVFHQNMAVVGGIPVKAPPGSDTDQNRRRERDSPGYGDLGVRHFSSTNSGLNASSVDVNMDPGFVSRRQPSKASLELSPKFGGSQGSIGGGGPAYPQHPASSLPLADNPYAVIGDVPTSFQLQQQQQQQRGDIGQSEQSIQGVNGAYLSLPDPQTIQSVPDTSV